MTITHAFVSGLADGSDATLVRPTNWNAAHTIANDTVTEAMLSVADNTTKDVSTSAHGFAPKAPNDATKFLDGTGAFDTVKDTDASTRTINAQTGTTYTFVLGDAGKFCTFSNAAAITVTVPPNSSVAFATGTQIDCAQIGAGKTTFAQGTGVTISSKGSNKACGAQYVGVTLVKTGTDAWLLMGELIA